MELWRDADGVWHYGPIKREAVAKVPLSASQRSYLNAHPDRLLRVVNGEIT